MTKSVYNNKEVDFTKQPIFFGEDLNVSGNPKRKYPVFNTINKRMKGFMWFPESKDLSSARSEYAQADEAVKHIFISNLKYQTLLDSVQKRGPMQLFSPIISNPEFESVVLTWCFFEHIHEDTYRHIAETMLPRPEDLYDNLIEEPSIKKRVNEIVKHYDIAIIDIRKFEEGQISSFEVKKSVYKAIISILLLEGVLFYNSFISNFSITEKLNILEAPNKLIKEILRDENLHLAVTSSLVRILKSGKEGNEWVDAINECEDDVYEMFDIAVNQEKEWSKFLFSKGSILGFNEEILALNTEFRANQTLKMAGYNRKYNQKTNPIPWLSRWQSDDENQGKPQETELESYVEVVNIVGDIPSLFNNLPEGIKFAL